MNKIDKSSIKFLILEMVSISIAGIILWPLFDLLYHNFITHSEFVYSAVEYVVKPILFGCIMGLVFWVFGRRKG